METVIVSKKKYHGISKEMRRKPLIVGAFIISLGIAVFFSLPFLYMVLMGLMKDSNSILSYPPKFFSDKLYFTNFTNAWNYINFGQKLINTVI